MEYFGPGDRVVVRDHFSGNDIEAVVYGTWGVSRASGPVHYRVWVIMPDRTVRAYEKHEVRHVEAKENGDG